MQLIVLTDDVLKEELLSNGQTNGAEVVWLQKPEQFAEYKNAGVYCDLLFDASKDRIDILKNFSGTVIINSVDKTLTDLQAPFIRINGWPGFLKGSVVEGSYHDQSKMNGAEVFFSAFNKKV